MPWLQSPHSQRGVVAGVRWRHRCWRRSNGDICTHSHTRGIRDTHVEFAVWTQTDVFSVSHCVSSGCHGTQHNNMDTRNTNLCPCGDNVDTGVCAKRLLVLAWQWTLAEQGSLVGRPENTMLTYCKMRRRWDIRMRRFGGMSTRFEWERAFCTAADTRELEISTIEPAQEGWYYEGSEWQQTSRKTCGRRS